MDKKKIKVGPKTKSEKVLAFILLIFLIGIGTYFYKQKTAKVPEEPEVFISLDSTLDEYKEKDKPILEPKREIIEIKEELGDEFSLKSTYEIDIMKNKSFDEFSSVDTKENEKKDEYEETEEELNTLIKEFKDKSNFEYKSDEEIWKELDEETKKLKK